MGFAKSRSWMSPRSIFASPYSGMLVLHREFEVQNNKELVIDDQFAKAVRNDNVKDLKRLKLGPRASRWG